MPSCITPTLAISRATILATTTALTYGVLLALRESALLLLFGLDAITLELHISNLLTVLKRDSWEYKIIRRYTLEFVVTAELQLN